MESSIANSNLARLLDSNLIPGWSEVSHWIECSVQSHASCFQAPCGLHAQGCQVMTWRERSHEDDVLLVARDPLLKKNTQLRAVNQLPRCNLSLYFEGELVRERIWYQGRLNTSYTSLLKDAWWTIAFSDCLFNSHLRPGNHSPSDSRKMNKSACPTTLVTRHCFVPHVTNSLT